MSGINGNVNVVSFMLSWDNFVFQVLNRNSIIEYTNRMNFVNIKQRWVIGDEYLLINHLLSNDFSSFEVIEIVLDYYGSSLLYCDVSFCNDIVRCRVSTQQDYFFQFQNSFSGLSVWTLQNGDIIWRCQSFRPHGKMLRLFLINWSVIILNFSYVWFVWINHRLPLPIPSTRC